jgi:YD repeat-containing protein
MLGTAGFQPDARTRSTECFNEQVDYTYDMWNRLTAATATNGAWGESYTFDNFGSLTGKMPTVGTASALSVSVNPATNQQSGAGGYDANGNSLGNRWIEIFWRLCGSTWIVGGILMLLGLINMR